VAAGAARALIREVAEGIHSSRAVAWRSSSRRWVTLVVGFLTLPMSAW
jgi:hypothetical protein